MLRLAGLPRIGTASDGKARWDSIARRVAETPMAPRHSISVPGLRRPPRMWPHWSRLDRAADCLFLARFRFLKVDRPLVRIQRERERSPRCRRACYRLDGA